MWFLFLINNIKLLIINEDSIEEKKLDLIVKRNRWTRKLINRFERVYNLLINNSRICINFIFQGFRFREATRLINKNYVKKQNVNLKIKFKYEINIFLKIYDLILLNNKVMWKQRVVFRDKSSIEWRVKYKDY